MPTKSKSSAISVLYRSPATLGPIRYSDFGISILRLPPQVASVEDEVILELAFAAEPR